MTKSGNKHNWKVAILFAVIMMFALPVISYAQGRGNGRGRGRGSNLSWKCRVFVNCHDARDGRLDNRGPRGSRIGYRNGILLRRSRVRLDRDGDGDFDRNDRRLRRQQNTRWQIRNARRNGRLYR
jgi:hypothetical protein